MSEAQAPYMIEVIPAEVRERVRVRAHDGTLLKLDNLLELRDVLDEIKHRGEPVVMQFYEEAAADLCRSKETVRHDLATIREYTEADLRRWLNNGLSFDHIVKANMVAEVSQRTPKELLDDALDNGDEHGHAMTVDKMLDYALGGRVSWSVWKRVNMAFGRLVKLATRTLKGDRRVAFDEWLEQGRQFFVEQQEEPNK
jgi:hypothetical protein